MPARTVFIGCQPLVVQIILYAVLGVRFGREHRLAVHSCAEAIHALCVSIPGFKRFLRLSEERGLTFAVFRGKQNLSVDEMDMRSGRAEPIRIAPIVMGRKAGLFQTIAGIALIVVGAITQLYYLVAAGAGLAIGGVATLLSPSLRGCWGKRIQTTKPVTRARHRRRIGFSGHLRNRSTVGNFRTAGKTFPAPVGIFDRARSIKTTSLDFLRLKTKSPKASRLNCVLMRRGLGPLPTRNCRPCAFVFHVHKSGKSKPTVTKSGTALIT